MSDTSPRVQAALRHDAPKALPPKGQPGGLLFEFLRGHDRFLCELRDHGPYGTEAQFYENEEFVFSRRFDSWLDARALEASTAALEAQKKVYASVRDSSAWPISGGMFGAFPVGFLSPVLVALAGDFGKRATKRINLKVERLLA